MKTARKVAVAWELTCPWCGTALYNLQGSLMFTAEEIERSGCGTRGTIGCDGCQRTVKLPNVGV